MRRLTSLLGIVFAFSSSSFAAGSRISSADLERRIEFSYASTDGVFALECKHWVQNESSGDFSVICGKGTSTVKEFSVHLVVREFVHAKSTTFEVLYWVTDRNTRQQMPAFSSHSQLFTVAGKSQIQKFIMSQGLENDGSQMRLQYTP
jgi:hypothetical protein